MNAIARTGKTLVVGTLAAAFGVGAIAGVVAERALVGRTLRRNPSQDEQYGALHSDRVEVIANDGLRIHAEVEAAVGAPDDLTIIFAHGYALRMDEFHYQRRDLRHLARMVFYDQRGHGLSERGERQTHTVGQLAADLEAVIDQTTPTGPIVLVGHSMGGMTIQALAALRPDLFETRIKGVVLVCTSSGGVTEVPLGLPSSLGKFIMGVAPTVTEALKGQQAIVDRSREAGSDLTLLLTRRYSFGSGATAALTDFVANMHGTTSIDIIADYLAAFNEYDSKTSLPTLGHTITIVVGGEADLLTPPSSSQEIHELIPGSELILIPDTGHMLPLERYEELNEIITAIAQRVRTTSA